MQRPHLFSKPLLIAAAALVLSAPAAWAQHEEHGGTAAHACACCGNSSSAAMNHASEGGCCSHMKGASTGVATDASKDAAANVAPADAAAVDHSAHVHPPAEPTAATPQAAPGMNGMACGHHAAKNAAEDKPLAADAAHQDHASGCCGHMAAKTGAAAAGNMAGCCAKK